MNSPLPPPTTATNGAESESARQKRTYKKRKRLGEDDLSTKRTKAESSDSGSEGGSTRSEQELKRERRKLQNRNAAATSRMKKKAYMDELEAQIAVLMSKQKELSLSIQSLQAENYELKNKMNTQPEQIQNFTTTFSDSNCFEDDSEHVSVDHVSSPFSVSTCLSVPSSPSSALSDDSFSVSSSPELDLNSDSVHDTDVSSEFDWLSEASGAIHESAALVSPQWKALMLLSTMTLTLQVYAVVAVTIATTSPSCLPSPQSSVPQTLSHTSRNTLCSNSVGSSLDLKFDISLRRSHLVLGH